MDLLSSLAEVEDAALGFGKKMRILILRQRR
jgi:hypothetical protein